jgi:hypothetical protein
MFACSGQRVTGRTAFASSTPHALAPHPESLVPRRADGLEMTRPTRPASKTFRSSMSRITASQTLPARSSAALCAPTERHAFDEVFDELLGEHRIRLGGASEWDHGRGLVCCVGEAPKALGSEGPRGSIGRASPRPVALAGSPAATPSDLSTLPMSLADRGLALLSVARAHLQP